MNDSHKTRHDLRNLPPTVDWAHRIQKIYLKDRFRATAASASLFSWPTYQLKNFPALKTNGGRRQ